SDKREDDARSNQVTVEAAKPDAGPANATLSKSEHPVKDDSAKKNDHAATSAPEQPRTIKAVAKSGGSDGYDQKKHVQVQGDEKTTGKSGSNPDRGGGAKQSPAARHAADE